MAQKLNLLNLAVPPVTHRSNFPSTFTFGVATSAYQVSLSLQDLTLIFFIIVSPSFSTLLCPKFSIYLCFLQMSIPELKYESNLRRLDVV